MSTMDAKRSIRSFITDNFFVDEFADEDSFLNTGIVDSLGLLQLVGFVEEEFGITVADTELVPDNLDSVTRVATFVERKLAVEPRDRSAA